jgi:hypothetical protein
MPALIISEEATIADIVGTLNKPEDYVRCVLEHLWACKREHGSASVRIGVTGEGRAPNYRVEYPREGMKTTAVFEVYNGLSHRPIEGLGQWNLTPQELLSLFGRNTSPVKELPPSPEHSVEPGHWSSQAMSLEQVSALLGQLRLRKR